MFTSYLVKKLDYSIPVVLLTYENAYESIKTGKVPIHQSVVLID